VISSVLRPAACAANRVAGSQILVAVKEARDLLFQLSRKEWLGEGHGTREKFPLNFRGQIIPAPDDCRPQALQNMFFFLN
jgi:hypothetical protein